MSIDVNKEFGPKALKDFRFPKEIETFMRGRMLDGQVFVVMPTKDGKNLRLAFSRVKYSDTAWKCYLRGKEQGDDLDLELTENGCLDKRNNKKIGHHENGGLAGYLLRSYPDSKTCKELARAGYTSLSVYLIPDFQLRIEKTGKQDLTFSTK